MKKLIWGILVFPLALLAQKTDNKFVITGTITGLPEKSLITLNDVNNSTDTLDRTEIKNGSFVLKGSVAEPNIYQINFHGIQKKTILFLSNHTINILGSADNLQLLSIKGSPVHDDFVEFQNTFNPLFQKLGELNQQINSTPNIQRTDTVMILYKNQFEKIKTTIDQFVAKKKSSPIAPFLLVVTSEMEQDMVTLEKRFNLLDENNKKGFYGKIISQQIDESKIGAVGTDAIPFTQADTAGTPVSLASFKGKYVLVDFWASWCKPCRMENPNVVNAFNKFKSKNFTILGVSLDRSRDSWLQAIKEDNLTWTQVSDLKSWNNEVAQLYKIQSIPQNYLIDPTGKIVGKNLRGIELENKLCELLGCN